MDSVKRIADVSFYTFLEMVRSKVLYILLFFALFIFALGIGITQMTIGIVPSPMSLMMS